ncbi:MAG: acetyl-CoA carboxylase biotin carboxyl carrier protein [Defluviitaleaceae bacterium]|nr:acetyl-CoA carboxylase biotin carboxyl carrier protein [Defluviitaleaceae bacterium]
MDIKDIKELLNAFSSSSATLLQYEKNGESLILDKKTQITETVVISNEKTIESPKSQIIPEKNKVIEVLEEEKTQGTQITAPLVGIFHRTPNPSSPPFVEIGQDVKEGDTLFIIEAMKVFNEIKAPKDGKILSIHVSNGDLVEFGQILMEI